jgi:hypothetical protein
MAITPYSTPIQYEYKPLGLEIFAKPLAEMQKQFDTTLADVEGSTWDIKNTALGTDPEKAKKLKELVESKTDELAQNLMSTANFRQAGSKIKELRNLWANDPEKLNLESNYAKRQEFIKNEKERIDKPNGITRDEYYEAVARYDREYANEQGTNWKMENGNKEGVANVYNTKPRLANLERELDEEVQKLGKSVEADTAESALRAAGYDWETMDKKFKQTLTEARTPEKVRDAVRAYLLTQPRFTDWGKEKADFNFDKQINSPQADEFAQGLTNEYLATIDKALLDYTNRKENKGKDLSQDVTYQDLMAKKQEAVGMQQSGEYDMPLLHSIYTQNHLNKLFNMDAIGKLLAYEKQTNTYTFRSMPKPEEEDGGGSGSLFDLQGPGTYAPGTYDPTDLKGLYGLKNQANKTLFGTRGKDGKVIPGTLAQVNNIGKGNMRFMVYAGLNDKQKADLNTNPAALRAKQEMILTTLSNVFTNGGTYKDFHKALKQKGIDTTIGNAATIFKEIGSKDVANTFIKKLEATEKAIIQFEEADKVLKGVQENAKQSSEYRQVLTEISKYPVQIKTATDPNTLKQDSSKVVIGNKTYDRAKLEKAGIIKTAAGGKGAVFDLNLEKFAKFAGYKSFEEAISSGYNFNGLKLDFADYKGEAEGFGGDWTSEFSGTIQGYNRAVINRLAQKGAINQKMGYSYRGDKVINEALGVYTEKTPDLTTFQPMGGTWQNVAGFTEKGELAPGTKLMSDKTRLYRHGGTNYLEVTYSYLGEDGKTKLEKTVQVKPKKGTEARFEEVFSNIIAKTNNYENRPDHKQTNDVARASRFDLRFTGNGERSFSKSTVDALPVSEARPVNVVKTIPLNSGTNLVIEKVHATGNTYTLKAYTTNGVSKAYILNPATGKPFYSSDPEVMKAHIDRMYSGEY